MRGPLGALQRIRDADIDNVIAAPPVLPAARAVLNSSWVTLIAAQWRHEEHINSFELRAIDATVRRVLSSPSTIRSRLVLFSDSMVAVGSLSKGRSSAPPILRRVRSVAASLLASGIQLFLHWIPSADNPADGPSRYFSRYGTATATSHHS